MIFYVHLRNHVDLRDDDVIKIKAKDKAQAREIASGWWPHRFSVEKIYTAKEFRKADSGWYNLVSSNTPINSDGEWTT